MPWARPESELVRRSASDCRPSASKAAIRGAREEGRRAENSPRGVSSGREGSEVAAAVGVAARRGRLLFFWLVHDDGLGGQQQACDAGGVL